MLLANRRRGRQPVAEALTQRGEQRRRQRHAFENRCGHLSTVKIETMTSEHYAEQPACATLSSVYASVEYRNYSAAPAAILRRDAIRDRRVIEPRGRRGYLVAEAHESCGSPRWPEDRNELAAVTLDDKYIARQRPGLPDRHAGAGAPADGAAPARRRRRAQHRLLHRRLSRLAVGRARSGAVERAPLYRAQPHPFQPAINEEMAATAVWGSQQFGLFPGAKYDGVFAMWYGKGPGVDRSGDALKHGNSAGSAPHGGVLLLAGDDHTCKSSTLAHQSEFAFIDASIPVLNPAGVEEILDLGLYGWAMSRYSGCWVAFKTVAETMDSSASIAVDPGAGRDRLARGFRDAAGRAQHPLAGPAAGAGAAAAPLQARRGAGLRPRQPARPHRHRQRRGRASASSPPANPISTCARRSTTSASATPRRPRSASASTRWRCRGRSNPQGVRAFRRGARGGAGRRGEARVIETAAEGAALQLAGRPAAAHRRQVRRRRASGSCRRTAS